MKHVFIIGSHTPFLTAMGVIEMRKLERKDCIFVLGRNYKCRMDTCGIAKYDFSDIYYINLRGNMPNKVKKPVRTIDLFVDDKIADDYTLYTPHLSIPFFQAFATNKYCKDIKFIQEGIIDFCLPEGLARKPSLSQILINMLYMVKGRTWRGRGWNDYYYDVKHASETFAITNRIFREMNCKHTIIQWPTGKLPMRLDKDGVFFVFESLVEQTNIERDVFMNATAKLIDKFASKINYVKFHPSQSEENKQMIRDMFARSGLKLEELPSEIPFEMILACMPHIKVCGFTTSLLFFSALMPQHETHICVQALCHSKIFRKKYWNWFNAKIQASYDGVFVYEDL